MLRTHGAPALNGKYKDLRSNSDEAPKLSKKRQLPTFELARDCSCRQRRIGSQCREAKIGPFEMAVKEKETINIPVWAGIGAMVLGAGLLLVGSRKT